MSKTVENGEDNPPDDGLTGGVWPPTIERHIADSRVVLTKVQMERVHYFWIYVLAVPLSAGIGAHEYFSTSPGWWQRPLYKLLLLGLCLLSCVGNSWRAYQGWQIKAVLNLHRYE